VDKGIYKSISFRLNLNDESDYELYQRITDASERYSSISAFAKIVFENYFQELEEKRRSTEKLQSYERIVTLLERHTSELQSLITEGIHTEGMKIVGAMLSGMQGSLIVADTRSNNKSNTKETIMPDETDEIPDDMVGVLDFLI